MSILKHGSESQELLLLIISVKKSWTVSFTKQFLNNLILNIAD
jgi:hypothetical protein